MSPSWGVSRALPVADKARRASGRGRQGTSLLRQTKGLPGTATGRATAPHQNNFILYPGVAQLVGRLLWEQDAAGSNPVTRTKDPKSALRVLDLLFFAKFGNPFLRILQYLLDGKSISRYNKQKNTNIRNQLSVEDVGSFLLSIGHYSTVPRVML